MNFNYRDFFIHNDDLHIIKEQLSIVDELKVSKKDALAPNAKAVWDAWTSEKNTQTIADKLKINHLTVQKIIRICLMNTDEKKNSDTIANKFGLAKWTVHDVLNKALGSKRPREIDTHFINDAVKIYNLHKSGKHPEEIVVLVNNEKKEYFEKINLDKVNLILKVVDITKKQMDVVGAVNVDEVYREVYREIDKKIDRTSMYRLIKKLNLGKIRYTHKFTEEQDAFILYCYLQRNGTTEIAKQFNAKFSTKSNKLIVSISSIYGRIINNILKPKGESEISKYVLDLLDKYKTEYFPAVNIEDPYTKELLTHYTPPKTVGGRDTTGTGTNRDMSAHIGTLPKNFSTMVTNLRNAHTIR